MSRKWVGQEEYSGLDSAPGTRSVWWGVSTGPRVVCVRFCLVLSGSDRPSEDPRTEVSTRSVRPC